MLTLTASLQAAAIKKGEIAEGWLKEAMAFARRVPDDPASNWEQFSAANVGVWRVAIGVELGESGGAVLEKARQVNLKTLETTPNRLAAFQADVGRGLAREKKTRNEAVRWLRDAEDAAPQVIRNSKPVKHTLEVLHGQALASAVGVELRGMMARMGIPY
jgi:hypothetical protein